LSHLRGQEAGLIAGEQSRDIGIAAVAEAALVVVGGENGAEGTGLEPTLLARVLDDGLTSGNVSGVDALGLQLFGAVCKGGSLDGLEVFTAFRGLLGNIVAGMSSHEGGQQGKPARDFGEEHGGGARRGREESALRMMATLGRIHTEVVVS
jgi:hypothetical protein